MCSRRGPSGGPITKVQSRRDPPHTALCTESAMLVTPAAASQSVAAAWHHARNRRFGSVAGALSRDTTSNGILCRNGYHIARGTMSQGIPWIPCCNGYHGAGVGTECSVYCLPLAQCRAQVSTRMTIGQDLADARRRSHVALRAACRPVACTALHCTVLHAARHAHRRRRPTQRLRAAA